MSAVDDVDTGPEDSDALMAKVRAFEGRRSGPPMESRDEVNQAMIRHWIDAMGDDNPVYVDDAYARASEVGALIAPPTFVQASAQFDDEYPLRPKIGAAWFGSGPGYRASRGCPPASPRGRRAMRVLPLRSRCRRRRSPGSRFGRTRRPRHCP